MRPDRQFWFGLLGPLSVRLNGADVWVPPRIRAVLGTLLIHANAVVSASTLTETVWADERQAVAPSTIRSYVKRLRQVLGPAAGARIITRDAGYLIEILDGELDVLRFHSLFLAGGAAVSEEAWSRASELLGEGLSLWRGEALADVPGLRQEAARLEGMRLQSLEWRVDADLKLGRHGALVPELAELARAHPFRERFHAQLMLALVRCGRQAEALEAYQAARRTLVTELGIEPGPQLQQLHRRVLAGDAVLAQAPAAVVASELAMSVAPRQLPAVPRFFAGRAGELRELTSILQQEAGSGPALPVAVVCGIPGVGKTTLAVYWGHLVAERFPDGQLYVNLRGFDPSGSPLAPGQVVRGFLEALGVPAAGMPADLDGQVALYRSMLASQRMLVLLDNARDAEQVRPLLPGGPGCAVVVTSRDSLAGLVAAEGAHLIRLEPLDPEQARDLLASRLGRQAAEADELIDLCGRLPLALGIAAARAITVPGTSLAGLAAELREARLDSLQVPGEAESAVSVRAVFSWSYRTLTDQAAQMFRLLGLHPGIDIDILAAASLARLDAGRAQRVLGELTAAQLVSEHSPGRFVLHDLLRAYAAEQALACDGEAERRAALGRLFDHYLHTAHSGSVLMSAGGNTIVVPPLASGTAPQRLASRAEALAWFAAERRVLMAVIGAAGGSGFDRHAWQLPATLDDFFARRGNWHDWLRAQQIALAAALRLGDRLAEARVHRSLGDACIVLREFADAQEHFERALEIYRDLGCGADEGGCLFRLSRLYDECENYGECLRHARQALRLFREAGDKVAEAWARNAIGWAYCQLGERGHALVSCQSAVGLFRAAGSPFGEAAALDSLGYVLHQAGHPGRAVAQYRQAVVCYQRVGDRYYYAQTLIHLGDALAADGDLGTARGTWREALEILEDLRQPIAEQVRARLADGG